MRRLLHLQWCNYGLSNTVKNELIFIYFEVNGIWNIGKLIYKVKFPNFLQTL